MSPQAPRHSPVEPGRPSASPPQERSSGGTRSAARTVARRYRLHLPGVVYVLLTVLLVLGAVNSQNNLLFAIFGLAVAGIVVSGVVSGAALMGIRVSRQIVGPVSAGGTLIVRYTVRNANWFLPSGALTIEEVATSRNASLASTWNRHTAPIISYVPWLRARAEVVVEARVPAEVRGVATVNLIRVSSTFPFGLTRKYALYSQPDSFLVRPWSPSVPQSVLASLRGRNQSVNASRADRAVAGEFFALREYAIGDSPRSIAWRSSAKRGDVVVRQTADQGEGAITIRPILGSTTGPQRERLISFSAGLARLAAAVGREVGVEVEPGPVGVAGGKRHVERILTRLAEIPNGDAEGAHAAVSGAVTVSSPGCQPVSYGLGEIDRVVSNWEQMPGPPEAARVDSRPIWRKLLENIA